MPPPLIHVFLGQDLASREAWVRMKGTFVEIVLFLVNLHPLISFLQANISLENAQLPSHPGFNFPAVDATILHH